MEESCLGRRSMYIMSSPFKFNFLNCAEGSAISASKSEACEEYAGERAMPKEDANRNPSDDDHISFAWLDTEASFQAALKRKFAQHDLIQIDGMNHENVLRRITQSGPSIVSKQFENSDLVSGVYEGGMKVWECSVDMCRYFQENKIVICGDVLELGCGHGLPGCWVLMKARSEMNEGDKQTVVTFTDYNEFVLHDVTVPNVILNTTTDESNPQDVTWFSKHVVLGCGDWKNMSEQLTPTASSNVTLPRNSIPRIIPKDGKFDTILAAETTYSLEAARDTAFLLSKHLKRNTGVAYIATKRYYFGVGGGSDCFRDHLKAFRNIDNTSVLHVDTLFVYDDGAGNIRELLSVTWKDKDAK